MLRRYAVRLGRALIAWGTSKPFPESRSKWNTPDPLDVWFEWRLIYHYNQIPKPIDWDRLWAVFSEPK